MSSNLPDSKKMLAASKKSKGKTIIGYNYTKNPAVLHARELIESGVIGNVAGFFVGMMLIMRPIKKDHGRGVCREKRLVQGLMEIY